MIEKSEVMVELKRLRGLRGYPRQNPEAEGELVRICVKYAKDIQQIRRVIEDFVEDSEDCPKPVHLKDALKNLSGQSATDDGWKRHRICKYWLCVGDGWRVVTRGRYDGVTKCACVGGVMPKETVPDAAMRAAGEREEMQ